MHFRAFFDFPNDFIASRTLQNLTLLALQQFTGQICENRAFPLLQRDM